MATGEALCEMAQKFELATPKEQMETMRMGRTGPRPVVATRSKIEAAPVRPAAANPMRTQNGLPVFAERRSASQPVRTLVPAMRKSGMDKMRPMPRVEKPRD